jgi:hypothetical protein
MPLPEKWNCGEKYLSGLRDLSGLYRITQPPSTEIDWPVM